MHCGIPPVVRSIDTYEWLTERELCRKADSTAGFESALRELLDDPDERERIGANAREKSEEFTLNRVGEALVGLYRDLANGTLGENTTH
jgi:glycosyltransferase involved in cell wall biosynthesis